ncbi:ATP-binding protein [Parvibaculum sp.]|uniref:ATP-binding protein n=1 Tax=Parvibaculum sp. TaxID=2024848 RepID=UPI00391B234D
MSRRRVIQHGIEHYATVLEPEEALEPILAPPVRAAMLEWLTEIWAEAELAGVGIEPRRRALFKGPPGTGKTTLAHHLAARLGLPIAIIHPERIIDSWVGASAQNLGGVFDALEAEDAEPHLLFFDEFESIGGKRHQVRQGADHQHNGMVTTLLQRIERYSGFVVAATNREEDLDPAVWRRFDIQIDVALPEQEERHHILARYLAPYGLPDAELKQLAESFATASPALMRQFCESLKRQLIIGPKIKRNMQKEAVIARILAAVTPHPDFGLPRLWSLKTQDIAIRNMPWPLPLASGLPKEATPAGADDANVVPLGGKGTR